MRILKMNRHKTECPVKHLYSHKFLNDRKRWMTIDKALYINFFLAALTGKHERGFMKLSCHIDMISLYCYVLKIKYNCFLSLFLFHKNWLNNLNKLLLAEYSRIII